AKNFKMRTLMEKILTMNVTRNTFLKVVAASTVAGMTNFSGIAAPLKTNSVRKAANLQLGLASYTLRSMSLEEVIEVGKRLQLNAIALKSMHMPLESSREQIRNIAARVKAAGLTLYGAGVIYMKTEEEVKNAFAYAASAGLDTIIGVPNHNLLPLVDEHVKKYNIKLAIHNHGPGDDLYSSPHDVFKLIRDLDKRIGLCIDVGHVVRIGQNPVPMIEKYRDRLYDMHIKDMDKGEPEGKSIE